MTDRPLNPAGQPAPPELHSTLERIAAALEKRNAQAAQNGGEQGRPSKKDDGDDSKNDQKDDKKDHDDKDGQKKGFHPSPLAVIITLAALILVAAGALIWRRHAKTHVSTDDAYTAARVHQVSPRIAGAAIEVWVDDNQRVRPGDLLVKLDPRDYEVALERAQANLNQAHAQVLQAGAAITQAQAGIAQAEAQVLQARAQTAQAGANFEVAGVNYGRNSALFTRDSRAVARADVDTAKSSLEASQAAFDAAQANARAAEAGADAARALKESREAELVVARAQVGAAQANVDDAKLQLSYCWVTSPCAGRVARKTVESGQRLSPGQALLAVTEDDVWVLANLKETQLEHVRVGQRVKLPLDAFPGHPFTGRVDSLQAGSGATYALLPPDNATGNFTKIVQRVPVKLTFDRDSIKGFEALVVAGLSVVPVIDLTTVGDERARVDKDGRAPDRGQPRR